MPRRLLAAAVPLMLLTLLTACASDAPVTGTVESFDGATIAYDVRGAGSPTLVFVHGWSCDRSYWREQTDVFAVDHRVVTVDLAGHGESSADRERWHPESFAEDVKAVVEALDIDDAVLIGHSMAGSIVAVTGAAIPERVVGLIGIDTLQEIGEHYTDEQIDGFMAPMIADFPTVCDGWVRGMFAADADSALVAEVASDMASAPQNVAIPTIRGHLSFSPKAALAASGLKLACINSDKWPTNVDGIRETVPGFEVRVMEGVGHFPMVERVGEFNGYLAELIAGF